MRKTTTKGPQRQFGDKPIARLIALAGLSDEEFGNLAGATPRTVASWRRGDKDPPIERLISLVRVVSAHTNQIVSMDTLAGLEDKKI